jgi:transcriptional regulator with XRE-family HTH domain
MARAALGWTLKDLADRAEVNLNTISRYEAGFEILTGTMQKIEEVLRREGVVLVDEDDDFAPSIRIRKIIQPPALHAPQNPFRAKRQIRKTKPKSRRKTID